MNTSTLMCTKVRFSVWSAAPIPGMPVLLAVPDGVEQMTAMALADQARVFELSADEIEPVCLTCQALKEGQA